MKKRNRFLAAFIAALTIVAAVCATATPVAALSEDDMTTMTFGNTYTGGLIYSGSNYGNATINKTDKTVDITYAESTNVKDSHYVAKLYFGWGATLPKATHKYIRVLYSADMPEGAKCELTVMADSGNESLTFSNAISDTNGEYVYTDAKILNDVAGGILERFRSSGHDHNSFSFSTQDPSCTFKIKAVELYADASEFYSISFDDMTFEYGGNGTTFTGSNYGEYERNFEDATLDITYAAETNSPGYHYMAKVKFMERNSVNGTYNYVRVLYAADMPSGGTTVMSINPDGGNGTTTYFNAISDTNGEYVFSEAQYMDAATLERFVNGVHNSLLFDTTATDCTFKIKGIYFFGNAEDAAAYECPNGQYSVAINGNDIEANAYKIVIAEDAPLQVSIAATKFASYVYTLTGYKPAIVTDATAEGDYEILFGRSNRAKSYEYVLGNDDLLTETTVYGETFKEFQKYGVMTDGTTLIVTTHLPHNMIAAVDSVLDSYLYKGYAGIPASIDITTTDAVFGYSTTISYYYDTWNIPENVANPKVFTDDFGTDDGYFMEENGVDRLTIKDGVLTNKRSTYAVGSSLAYLHLYETNATFEADFTVTKKYSGSTFGIMLRYNDTNAYVKAGYDSAAGEWFIDSRDGEDFYRFRLASAEATVNTNEVYRLSLTVDGTSATLSVNGNELLTTDELTHLSPGRAAIFSNNVAINIDNAKLVMLSGQGELMKNVVHNILPTGDYTEGGTVIERADGTTLTYIPSGGTISFFNSTDDGKTWTATEDTITRSGYPNIIRLNNGELLQIYHENGYVRARFSSNDGKTWYASSQICQSYYNGDSTTLKAVAGNMNDKLFQSATTGYIYFCQNYEAPNTGTGLNGHRIFCDFFCSKDGGLTWELIGNTLNMTFNGEDTGLTFGECKILELADGTIRMYNSYNYFNCIVYSDLDPETGLFDNELTELVDVNGDSFPCSCSSMQFVRDPYAENDSTYYMVFVDNFDHENFNNTRCGLSVAYSEDGATWTRMGTLWRWESTYSTSPAINHVVDPFIQVTPTSVICGSGISGGILKNANGDESWHNGQRQHIYSLPKYVDMSEEGITVVTSANYSALAEGTKLVMISTDSNDATYTYGGTTLYYSAKYKAYVGVFASDVVAKDVYANAEIVYTPAEEIAYDGDVNGDGNFTAGDAALVMAMIINPDKETFTDKMRLEADFLEAEGYVTREDVVAILYNAAGLTYTPAE